MYMAPLRREANGLGPLEIDRGHPHVVTHMQNLRETRLRIKAVRDITLTLTLIKVTLTCGIEFTLAM